MAKYTSTVLLLISILGLLLSIYLSFFPDYASVKEKGYYKALSISRRDFLARRPQVRESFILNYIGR